MTYITILEVLKAREKRRSVVYAMALGAITPTHLLAWYVLPVAEKVGLGFKRKSTRHFTFEIRASIHDSEAVFIKF